MKKLILLLLPLTFLFSCEKEEFESNQIIGDWKLSKINLKADFSDDGPVDVTENLSDLGYVISFKSDGTYTAKIDENAVDKLNEIDWAEIGISSNLSGTYQLVDGLLTMKYFDTENEQNVTNKFKFKKESNEEFSFSMDRPTYLELIKEQLAPSAAFLISFGLSLDQLMKEIETDIKAFDLKITYNKLK